MSRQPHRQTKTQRMRNEYKCRQQCQWNWSKSNTTKNTPRVKNDSSKSKEEKSEDTAADENISESRITARETKNTYRKKENRVKAKITESSKKKIPVST